MGCKRLARKPSTIRCNSAYNFVYCPTLNNIWTCVQIYYMNYIIHTYCGLRECASKPELLSFTLEYQRADDCCKLTTTCVRISEAYQFNNLHGHDDVIKWKHFPRNWPFVRGIHRSPVNSPHKGQWRAALMFTLICVWINGCVNNREAGDLRRYYAHYGVTVMIGNIWCRLTFVYQWDMVSGNGIEA